MSKWICSSYCYPNWAYTVLLNLIWWQYSLGRYNEQYSTSITALCIWDEQLFHLSISGNVYSGSLRYLFFCIFNYTLRYNYSLTEKLHDIRKCQEWASQVVLFIKKVIHVVNLKLVYDGLNFCVSRWWHNITFTDDNYVYRLSSCIFMDFIFMFLGHLFCIVINYVSTKNIDTIFERCVGFMISSGRYITSTPVRYYSVIVRLCEWVFFSIASFIYELNRHNVRYPHAGKNHSKNCYS